MKRIHLYRGKRLDNGQWVEGFYSNLYIEEKCKEQSIITYQNFYAADMSYPYPSVNTVEAEVDSETVGQFTGMTDKNGTKIFEGDIVRHIDTTCHVFEVVNSEVYFDTEMLKFRFRYSNELFHCQFNNELEVIGNIYDNKDLLK